MVEPAVVVVVGGAVVVVGGAEVGPQVLLAEALGQQVGDALRQGRHLLRLDEHRLEQVEGVLRVAVDDHTAGG